MQKEWQDVKQVLEQEVVEAKAMEQAEAARTTGGGTDVGSSGATAGSVSGAGCSASAGASAEFIDNLAKEHVRAYVKLVQEPATTAGVELAVKQSSLCTIHGQERRNVFMIVLSTDNLAEVAGRAPHRRPPIEFSDLKKLVHGALLGRGGTRVSQMRTRSASLVEMWWRCTMEAGARCRRCSWTFGSPRTRCWALL